MYLLKLIDFVCKIEEKRYHHYQYYFYCRYCYYYYYLYLGLDSTFPREQVAPSNCRPVKPTLQYFLSNAAFCKSFMLLFTSNFFSRSFNLFDVTPRAPITTGTITT